MKFNKETNTSIGVSTGMTKLANGTITTPIAYLDLELPEGYVSFGLKLFGGTTSDGYNNIAFALSFDGGVNFLNDTVNGDSYLISYTYTSIISSNPSGNSYSDSLMDAISGQLPQDDDLQIFPGDESSFARLFGTASGVGDSASAPTAYILALAVNIDATVPPTPARANLIRILPYGNGDCNPPTSGETITTGSYILWGITV